MRCWRLQARVGGESWIRCSGELHLARAGSFDASVPKRPLLKALQGSFYRRSLPGAAALAYAIEVRTAALHICSAADGSIAGSSYSCIGAWLGWSFSPASASSMAARRSDLICYQLPACPQPHAA